MPLSNFRIFALLRRQKFRKVNFLPKQKLAYLEKEKLDVVKETTSNNNEQSRVTPKTRSCSSV